MDVVEIIMSKYAAKSRQNTPQQLPSCRPDAQIAASSDKEIGDMMPQMKIDVNKAYSSLLFNSLIAANSEPTAAAGTNTTQIATTAFVQAALAGKEDKLYEATGSGSVPGGGTWEAIRVGRLVTLTISGQNSASVTLPEELRPAIAVYGATRGTTNLTTIGTDGVITCRGGASTITHIAAS